MNEEHNDPGSPKFRVVSNLADELNGHNHNSRGREKRRIDIRRCHEHDLIEKLPI